MKVWRWDLDLISCKQCVQTSFWGGGKELSLSFPGWVFPWQLAWDPSDSLCRKEGKLQEKNIPETSPSTLPQSLQAGCDVMRLRAVHGIFYLTLPQVDFLWYFLGYKYVARSSGE